MDRFIVFIFVIKKENGNYLKSNMDRFIGAPRDTLVLIDEIFKIQYGQIYRQL